LFEYSQKNWTELEATRRMLLLSSVQFQTTTHDVSFKMYTSFGHAFALEQNATTKAEYRKVLLQTANSLTTRFNARVGCVRSWSWGRWKFPVIIDNMMNLELLCWAAAASGMDQSDL